ncbi:MAG: hypothetical protein ABI478_06165 [Propionivibrio sp.]
MPDKHRSAVFCGLMKRWVAEQAIDRKNRVASVPTGSDNYHHESFRRFLPAGIDPS